MDSEFAKLLRQVANGAIDDVERVREIIADARTAIRAKEDALREMKDLLLIAQESFLTGRARPA